MGISFVALVEKNTERAREKHPHFADDKRHILILALEELGEAAQALNDGDEVGFLRELIDVATVVQRTVEGR